MNELDAKLRELEKLLIGGKFGYPEIQERLGIEYEYARKLVQLLKENGSPVQDDYHQGRKKFFVGYLEEEIKETFEYQVPTDEFGGFYVGVVGDTHLGSKFDMLPELHAFYDVMQEKGIHVVLGLGDMVDGIKGARIRPSQLHALRMTGYDEMRDYAVDKFPYRELTDGTVMKYATVDGNHEDWFIQEYGANIVKNIAEIRDDVDYVGHKKGRVKINGIELMLIHPRGSPPYTKSYASQKYIRSLKDLPDVFLLGHYHSLNYSPLNGVHTVMCPAFQAESDYAKDLSSDISYGGLILYIRPNEEGKVKQFSVEFHDYERK